MTAVMILAGDDGGHTVVVMFRPEIAAVVTATVVVDRRQWLRYGLKLVEEVVMV
ncbi:hypothetical protein A2U01_0030789 [Trifolium medium]|uniref:Uncharacterized protein n=1 Tax=Trifolium medium TaxID=97028 RepID=A0A392PE04_9FABA|nr:hypothetical protein [Trifolium medium]